MSAPTGPMDPERLAGLREEITERARLDREDYRPGYIISDVAGCELLLAAHDYQAARAELIEDRLVELAERFAEAGLVGARREVEAAIVGCFDVSQAKARVVQLTERAEAAEADVARLEADARGTL